MRNYVAKGITVRCFDLEGLHQSQCFNCEGLCQSQNCDWRRPLRLKCLTAIYPLLNNVPVRSLTYVYIAHIMSFLNIINCEICNALGSSLHPPSRINHHTYRQGCAGAEAYMYGHDDVEPCASYGIRRTY